MGSHLDKMSLSDLNLLKSLLENKLSAKENWVNAERGHNLHEYNRRYLEFKNDKDHERLKIVKEKINDIVSFPLIFDVDNNLPSKDEIMNIGYEKAKNADYNYRKVLSDLDNDIYYSGWMDCYDFVVKKMPNTQQR